jgi:4,5:9,10-diseco-3-hydroxy-5,9,17-trioxoandrosta-1(10),2-diene-4-oate hydrolase
MSGRLARWSAVILPLLGSYWARLDRVVPNPQHRAEWLSVDGVRLRTVRAGNASPTLILIHGYGESLTTWRSVYDRLAENHRVIALDLPGAGGSDKPDSSYSLPALTRRLSRFLDLWTEGPLVIVGHSMGGEVAASLALARPDRVDRVILIAPAGYRVGLGGIVETMSPGRARTIGKYLALRSFITPIHDPGWMYEPDSLAGYDLTEDPAYSRAATRVLEEFDFTGLRDRFKDITQPTLLIWGGLDPVVPFAVGDTLSRIIPCVRYVPLPKAFHRPQAEVPDTVIAAIRDFLEGMVGRSDGKTVSGCRSSAISGMTYRPTV